MSNNLSQRLYELRKKQGMTLEQVANEVGVGKSTVRKWETGIIANMKRDKIALLAHALHTSPGYLMGWENENEFSPSQKDIDESKAEVISFNENEEKLLECFRACDLEGQIKILNTAIEQRDAREKIARSKTTTNA